VNQQQERHSKIETYLSLTILFVLAGIAAGIFFAQFQYNPAVLQLTSRQSVFSSQLQVSQPAASSALIPLPEGIIPLTPPEEFDPQTLSDKINGKADLYLSAGFIGLKSQRFKKETEPDAWMELFIYDMGSTRNAFSVYSAQRRDNAEPLDLTRHAYRTENAVFVAHGQYYLEIIAATELEEIFEAIFSLAQAFIHDTQVEGEAVVAEKDLFPSAGQVDNNITMISSDAFGYSELDNVFIAEYTIEGAEATAFLSRRESPQAAEQLAAAYHEFLSTYGGADLAPEVAIEGARMIEIFDTYEMIFSYGPYLAGVHEATDKTQAQNLAVELYKKLTEVGYEP
jgi:hypothetical protein